MVSGAEFFAEEEEESSHAQALDVCVWACNWVPVEVFECCRIELVGGMGASYNGISASEAMSACTLLDVSRREWPEVLTDVQFMGRVVSAALNKRIAEAPRNKV